MAALTANADFKANPGGIDAKEGLSRLPRLFKGGKTVPPPPKPTTRIYAMAERMKKYEITFPNGCRRPAA